MAVITQRLNRLSPQKPRIEIGPWMNRVTFITDERQIGVVGSVVKRRFLVRVPTTGYVTIETKAVAERKAHVVGFLKGAHEVRHRITRCLGFYQ